MRLSEREKKYVLVLVILLLGAALYFFYNAAVTPFLLHKAEMEMEIATLEMQQVSQEAKVARLEPLKADLVKKTRDATNVVKPFYPDLPQDRILLLVHALVTDSGLTVASIDISGLTVAEPGIQQMPFLPLTYRLKELAILSAGEVVEAQTEATQAQAAEAINGIPQLSVNLSFEGSHQQVLAFIQSCEALDRTVAISSLTETKSVTTTEDGEEIEQMAGALTVNFFAVEKPKGVDDFLAWTLPPSAPKTDLFEVRFLDPETEPEPEPETEEADNE